MKNSAYTKPLYVVIKNVTVTGAPIMRVLTTGEDFVNSRFVNIWQHTPKTWKTLSGAQKNAARFEGAEVGYVTHKGYAPVN